MKYVQYIYICFFFVFFSCEQNIEIDVPNSEPKIVVEGFIENNAPPYVILTKTVPFFDPTSIEDVENSFIHGAIVKVTDGVDTVLLTEVASDTLSNILSTLFIDSLGQELPQGGGNEINFYFYTNLTYWGSEGKSYWLLIETPDGEELSALTNIPEKTPLDSIWYSPHPDEGKNDSLAVLNGRFTDPAGINNYVRYFTRNNSEPYYPPIFQSVIDDKSYFNIDGESLNFTFEPGIDRTEFDEETYGYVRRGDTVTVKWSAIDEAHYDFWITLEFDRNGQGSPFARPTIINSNINGGLGIWGGYASTYKTIVIGEK